MKWTLTVPGRPPSWNDLYSQKHWSHRSAIAKGIHAEVAVAYMQAGADAPAFEYPVSLTVTAYFTGRRQDCSNITGKLYEDGLVACGILPDDTPKYVGSYTTRSRRSKTGEDYVVIEIDEVDKDFLREREWMSKFILPDGRVIDGFPISMYNITEIEGKAYTPISFEQDGTRLRCIGEWNGGTLKLNDEGIELFKLFYPVGWGS